jgi:hypothetical protein
MVAQPDTISETEKQALRRENIQTLLLLNQYKLAPNSVREIKAGGTVFNRNTNDIFHYLGPANDIPNLIINSSDTIDFMRAKSDQLSVLQPKLEFYIGSKSPGGDTLFSDEPILFSDYVSAQKMIDFAGLRSQGVLSKITESRDQLGTNVGVKSFSWNFDNKHQGDRIIKANLELYFGSMVELLNATYLNFIKTGLDPKPSSRTPEPDDPTSRPQWLQNRINRRKEVIKKGEIPQELQADSGAKGFKILKVKCGWAIPQNTNLKMLTDSFMSGIKASQRVILLNLSKYNINFGENGTVTLSIEYVGSFDAQMLTNHTDVLAGYATRPAIEDLLLALPVTEESEDKLYKSGYIKNQIANRNPAFMVIDPNSTTVDASGGVTLSNVMRAAGATPGAIWDMGASVFWDGRAVLPLGYTHGFVATLKGLKAEIELIEEEIDLRETTQALKRGSAQQSRKDPPKDEKLRALNSALDEASVYLTFAQRNVRTIRYQVFMKRIITSKVLFTVTTTVGGLRGPVNLGDRSANLRSVSLKLGSTRPGAGDDANIEARLIGLASADHLRGTTDLNEYLEQKRILDPLTDAAATQENLDASYTTFYMRLGDLLSIALANAPIKGGREAALIMGSYHPHAMGYKHYAPGVALPLADLPIALTTFTQWFSENIVAMERDSFPFRRFLDSILNNLVSPMMNFAAGKKPKNKIKFGYTTIPLRLGPTKISNLSLNNTEVRATRFDSSLNREVTTGSPNFLTSRAIQEIKSAYVHPDNPYQQRRTVNYLLIFAEQGSNLNGNRDEDEGRGIYHFFVGADTGLAKKFAFSEKQMPQVRAMNIESSTPTNRAGIMVLPQDCSLTMVGNNTLINGSMIYINADMALGQAAARQLKLGGYYRVVKSSHEIGPGTFTSTIEAIHERMPGDGE